MSSEWTGKYGTRVGAIVAAGLTLAGSLLYYATGWHVYAETPALLCEGMSERENIDGGITKTNYIGLQDYRDIIVDVDARILNACPHFVRQGMWDSAATNYVMYDYPTLVADAMAIYNPEGTTNWGQWLSISKYHVYATDFKKRFVLLYLCTNTVAGCGYGCGTKSQYSGSVDNPYVWYRDGDPLWWGSNNFFCCSDAAAEFAGGLAAAAGLWRGSSLTLSDTINAGPYGTPSTGTVCGSPPSWSWSCSDAFYWNRWLTVYPDNLQGIDQSMSYPQWSFSDLSVALQCTLPARQVPIAGVAVFRWGGFIFEEKAFATNDATVVTLGLAGSGASAQSVVLSANASCGDMTSSCVVLSTNCPPGEKVLDSTSVSAGSTGYTPAPQSGGSTNDLLCPTLIQWSMDYCVKLTP